MSTPLSSTEMDDMDVIEISSSPSSRTSPSHHQVVSELQKDLKNDDAAVDMSSSVGTAVSDYTRPTGGTSFLDLPLELRTMVYDIAIPRDYLWEFPKPGKPLALVKGINLLRSCRQIREETSCRVWYTKWNIHFEASSVNMRLAMSSLTSSAMAKVRSFNLSFDIDPDALSSWGPIDLKGLSSLKSLIFLDVVINWGHYKKHRFLKLSEDATFFTGLVIQILTQIPQQIRYVNWILCYCTESMELEFSKVLENLATRYKSLRGYNCKSQANNSSKNPNGVSP